MDYCGKCIHGGKCQEAGKYGNLYIRPIVFGPKGSVVEGHKHFSDHVTLITNGSVQAEGSDGTNETFAAPSFIKIPATVWHKFTSLEDNTQGFCVFALHPDDKDAPNTHDAMWRYGNILER